MAFKVDKQTIGDLKIVSDNRDPDVYSVYNRTRTRGGAEVLKNMFLFPRSKAEEINNRSSILRYFKDNEIKFPFDSSSFENIEFYLSNTDERTSLVHRDDELKRKWDKLIGADVEFQQIHRGVLGTLHFLIDIKKFVSTFQKDESIAEFNENIDAIKEVLSIPRLEFLADTERVKKLSFAKTAEFDGLFRFTIRKEILELLQQVYYIDVFSAVAEVATQKDFAFAEIDQDAGHILEMKGVYHPLVPNAVGNDLHIDEDSNMIFLTGANMAGKSTFMKTFSIAIYLAHMGFPIPGKAMRFSVQNGMFTTINLSDNLNMGFSHFYAEVARLKEVAESVNENDRLIVVFDELFRGTNVKDAYDATVAVMDAFATKRQCTFVISTHIIEAGEVLKGMRDNIKFQYLPTVMEGNVPKYTYTITEGITSDRHGMVIIENEKILDILKV